MITLYRISVKIRFSLNSPKEAEPRLHGAAAQILLACRQVSSDARANTGLTPRCGISLLQGGLTRKGFLATLLLIAGGLWPISSKSATQYVEGDVIVTFKPATTQAATTSALSRKSLALSRRFGWLSSKRGRETGLIRDKAKKTAQLIADLKNDPTVESAEPNYLRWVNATPNDARFGEMWSLRNSGQAVVGNQGTPGADVKFTEAWALSRITNEEVVVGVIDTGVDYIHPDLQANMWFNSREVNGGLTDADANGYKGDYFGYNFEGKTANPTDSGYHGTHVAGTIAAVGNNQLGTIGVNYRAKVMALRVSADGNSIDTAATIEAIQYAIMMKNRGVNVVALNASYGGGGDNAAERAAIQEAGNAGIIFCAAAGNATSNIDTTPNYPASYHLPNMIVVAATDQNDALASFSNYGVNSVDIAAPGANILSTQPTSSSLKIGETIYNTETLTFSGTTSGLSGAIYYCGQGMANQFPAGVKGNFALIERGDINFSDKVTNAMNAGAKAAIIYNNVSGNFFGTLGSPGNWIPTKSITRADGLAIKAALPATGSLVVTANYQFLDGTSMATPHVSGAVAFAAMNFPNETLAQRMQRILSSVDLKISLNNKVATRGRLNLLKIVDANKNGTADWIEKSGPNAPVITSAPQMQGGVVHSTYAQTLTATGGGGPILWSLLSGALPDGLTLSSEGVVAGIPTTPGNFSFVIQVSDGFHATSGLAMSLDVAAKPLAITSAPLLASGLAGSAYSAALTADGGTPVYVWNLTSGILPPGLTLSASGTLTGTPTAAGTFDFSASVMDGGLTLSEQAFTLVVIPLPLEIISPPTLAVGALNTAYLQTLTAVGGTGAIRWSVIEGSLPPGLRLDSTGSLTGEPTSTGTFIFRALAVDSASMVSTEYFTIVIESTPVVLVTAAPIGAGVRSVNYKQIFSASGGTPPYSWSRGSGTLPLGMILNSSGNLGGTPTQSGSFNFSVVVRDSVGYAVSRDFVLTITPSYLKPVVNAMDLGSVTVGIPYLKTVTAINYPKTFSITQLPPGLTYTAATGVISGRPSKPGVFEVQVKATNAAGTSDAVKLPLVVNALPPAFIGSFTGIISRSFAVNANLGSRLTLTTTPAGAYTAKVTTGAATKSVTGFLAESAPQISVQVGAGVLSLTFDAATQMISGTHGLASVNGWRTIWSASLKPASAVGYYTVGINLADSVDRQEATVPQGGGYAAITLAPTGTLTVAGRASDGTAFSSAGPLGPRGEIPVYGPLYANLGSILGTLVLRADDNAPFLDNSVDGRLTWFKPDTKTRTYPARFGPINLDVFGKYLSSTAAKGIATGLPATGTADLVFTDGGIEKSATQPDVAPFTFTAVKTVNLPKAGVLGNLGKATLTINKASGLIGGSFTLVEPSPASLTRRVTFQGMVVRPATGSLKAIGYFLLPQIPISGQTINTSPILSGKVIIDQPNANQ